MEVYYQLHYYRKVCNISTAFNQQEVTTRSTGTGKMPVLEVP